MNSGEERPNKRQKLEPARVPSQEGSDGEDESSQDLLANDYEATSPLQAQQQYNHLDYPQPPTQIQSSAGSDESPQIDTQPQDNTDQDYLNEPAHVPDYDDYEGSVNTIVGDSDVLSSGKITPEIARSNSAPASLPSFRQDSNSSNDTSKTTSAQALKSAFIDLKNYTNDDQCVPTQVDPTHAHHQLPNLGSVDHLSD